MIAELEWYQGVVLRQLLVARRGRMSVGVANVSGRVDAFAIEGAAIQIKHSSKRLPPWRFTYMPENLAELLQLERSYAPVWVMLVCGEDGVVCLSRSELEEIVEVDARGAAWVRVSRERNAMYRVGGRRDGLPRAKPRGVSPFLAQVVPVIDEVSPE